jgi:hypothetical protein
MLNTIKRPYYLFKDKTLELIPMTPDHVVGVCHVDILNKEFINTIYGSTSFSEEYDKLPLLVRMWMTTWRWKQL